jgi:hypothetical protein
VWRDVDLVVLALKVGVWRMVRRLSWRTLRGGKP